MADKDFLSKTKTYYEFMIDNVMDKIKQEKDLTDPKVQSLHRLACQETNVYMRILKKLSDAEKNPPKQNLTESSPTNTGGSPQKTGNGAPQQDISLRAAVQNLYCSLMVCMMVFYTIIWNKQNFISIISACQHWISECSDARITSIRHSIAYTTLKKYGTGLSPLCLYLQWLNHFQSIKDNKKHTIRFCHCERSEVISQWFNWIEKASRLNKNRYIRRLRMRISNLSLFIHSIKNTMKAGIAEFGRAKGRLRPCF